MFCITENSYAHSLELLIRAETTLKFDLEPLAIKWYKSTKLQSYVFFHAISYACISSLRFQCFIKSYYLTVQDNAIEDQSESGHVDRLK